MLAFIFFVFLFFFFFFAAAAFSSFSPAGNVVWEREREIKERVVLFCVVLAGNISKIVFCTTPSPFLYFPIPLNLFPFLPPHNYYDLCCWCWYLLVLAVQLFFLPATWQAIYLSIFLSIYLSVLEKWWEWMCYLIWRESLSVCPQCIQKKGQAELGEQTSCLSVQCSDDAHSQVKSQSINQSTVCRRK